MKSPESWALPARAGHVHQGVPALAGTCIAGVAVGTAILLTVNSVGASTGLLIGLLGLCSLLLGTALVLRPAWVVVYFAWVAAQNIILPWFNNLALAGTDVVRAAIGVKETIALSLLAFALVEYFRTHRGAIGTSERLLVAYGGLLALALVSPWPVGQPFGARLVGFRTLVMPFAFLMIGRFWPADRRTTRTIIGAYIGLFVLLGLFGLFERLFLPVEFWSSVVGMGSYITDVKGILPDFHVENGVVANMFRFGIRRLVSTFGDPLSCGYALVLPTLLVSARLWVRDGSRPARGTRGRLMIALFILGASLVLTINRGAILTVLTALLLLFSRGTKFRFVVIVGLALLALGLWQPDVARMVYETVTLQEGSARTHFDHLVLGVPSLVSLQYIFGLGLGRSGFWAQELYGTTVPGIGENAFFMLILQVGFIGALLFVASILAIAIALRGQTWDDGRSLEMALCRAVGASLLAHLIVANTSENLFSFTGMGQAWFMTGLALRASRDGGPAGGTGST